MTSENLKDDNGADSNWRKFMIFNSYNTAAEEIFLINYTEVIRPTSLTLKIPIGYNNIIADT